MRCNGYSDEENDLIDNNQNTPVHEKKKNFENACENIVTYVIEKLVALGITLNQTHVKSVIFGENPKANFAEDGAVINDYKCIQTLSCTQQHKNKVNEKIEEKKDITVKFKSVFTDEYLLPQNREDCERCIEVIEKEDKNQITVKVGTASLGYGSSLDG